ncbi:MAG TPA: GNAT family N-acetyltransferase [Opitutae bacterium]|nr:GNAT family N-acetyltransferase [Opitutae bacterium]HAF58826.1 GNAT family N-acetyltransferase [Opitutae bacterium]|tara:strand:+ start:1122 stop:1556 length:435 start_codon:yes stop_codon:yes gene_type:complete
MILVREVLEPLATDMEQLNLLIPQLSGSAEPMTQTEFAEIINSSTTHLYVAEENHTILGMLSLAIFPIPTGVRAWVEDVVVKTEARGKGVGKLLTLHAISESKKFGAVSLDLTSRPSREIANKLYQSVGFDVRETNVYRYIHKE